MKMGEGRLDKDRRGEIEQRYERIDWIKIKRMLEG